MAPNDAGYYGRSSDFYRVLSDAIKEMAESGFDNVERLSYWIGRIRTAAVQSMTPPHVLEAELKANFSAIFDRLIEKGGIARFHPGIGRFTVERLRPKLRAELDRRLMASRSLIKLNREQAVESTIRRFAGWSTSVPDGGSDVVNRRETAGDIRKALAQLPFAERRCSIDQGHKFVSNLNNIIATDGGAIAAEWHSHWRQRNYNARIEHKHFDGHVFVIRDNWAIEKGLMKLDGRKYTDQVEAPAELPFCRCTYRYIYSLRSLPPDMVTARGKEELARVQMAMAG